MTTARRKTTPSRAWLVAGITAVASAAPAAAQAPTTPTQQAASYQSGLDEWLQSFVGAMPRLPPGLITVQADGDHYVFRVPLLQGTPIGNYAIRGTPLGGGRWTLTTGPVQKTYRFDMDLPKPDGAREHIDIESTYRSQTSHTLLDTSFATPSTSETSLDDVRVTGRKTSGTDVTTLAHAEGATTIMPTSSDRVTMTQKSELTGYHLTTTPTGRAYPIEITIGKAHQNITLTEVSRSAIHVITQTATHEYMASLAQAGQQTNGRPNDAQGRAIMQAVVPLLPILLRGIGLEQDVEDLKVDMGSTVVGLKHLGIGFGSRARDGSLATTASIEAERPSIMPTPPQGGPADLIPTRLSLKTTIAGMPTEAIATAMNRTAATGRPDADGFARVFGAGTVTASIESLEVDVAGSHVSGHVNADVVKQNHVSGFGQVRATKAKELQRRLTAVPQLAQAGMMMAFAIGIGRVEGDETVWDVTFENGKVLVNGQDVAALMAGPGRRP